MASLLSMFGGQGVGATVQPTANPGGGVPPTGPGFGLGQPLMQNGQMAQPTGAAPQGGMLGGMMGAGGQQADPAMMQKLMMMQQMMQQQQQPPQGGMAAAMMPMSPLMGQRMGGMAGQMAGGRGQYLAQGGGMQGRMR